MIIKLLCMLNMIYIYLIVYAYLLLHHGEHTLYRLRAGNVNSVTLLSYGDIQMTACILTF